MWIWVKFVGFAMVGLFLLAVMWGFVVRWLLELNNSPVSVYSAIDQCTALINGEWVSVVIVSFALINYKCGVGFVGFAMVGLFLFAVMWGFVVVFALCWLVLSSGPSSTKCSTGVDTNMPPLSCLASRSVNRSTEMISSVVSGCTAVSFFLVMFDLFCWSSWFTVSILFRI